MLIAKIHFFHHRTIVNEYCHLSHMNAMRTMLTPLHIAKLKNCHRRTKVKEYCHLSHINVNANCMQLSNFQVCRFR